jgi:hypothetical protein
LERLGVDGDHRVAELRLTAEGEQLLARVEVEMRRRLRDLASLTIDPDRLLEALVWLGQAVDQWRAERRLQAAESGRPGDTR